VYSHTLAQTVFAFHGNKNSLGWLHSGPKGIGFERCYQYFLNKIDIIIVINMEIVYNFAESKNNWELPKRMEFLYKQKWAYNSYFSPVITRMIK
jgi:hypothetical protein